MWECLFIFQSWRRVFLGKESAIDSSFLSVLENIVPLSCLHSFRWIKPNWHFPIGNLLFLSGCFQDFCLYLVWEIYDMFWWGFLCVYPVWNSSASWFCRFMFFVFFFFQMWDVVSHYMLKYSFSFPSGTPKDTIVGSFLIVPQVPGVLLI